MAISTLPTNYKDDILATSNTARKYEQVENADGTISLTDKTEYMQVGTLFGASDINQTNAKVNEVIAALDNTKITVDTAMSATSTNAVQNKVIKSYVDNKQIAVDSALSSKSTNPVQNKVINDYIGEQVSNLNESINDAKTYAKDYADSVIKAFVSKVATQNPKICIMDTQTTLKNARATYFSLDIDTSQIKNYSSAKEYFVSANVSHRIYHSNLDTGCWGNMKDAPMIYYNKILDGYSTVYPAGGTQAMPLVLIKTENVRYLATNPVSFAGIVTNLDRFYFNISDICMYDSAGNDLSYSNYDVAIFVGMQLWEL